MDKTFPERVKGLKSKVFEAIPEGSVRDFLWWQYMKSRWPSLEEELKSLNIEGFWVDRNSLCVRSGGLNFFGDYPSRDDVTAYKFMSKSIKNKIPQDYFGIATDIITRFLYPQAIPVAPDIPQYHRLAFSWHHTETIRDMDLTPEDKLILSNRFVLRKEDVVLDVGAYIGYGTMGMSRQVGNKGRVIAFECNPAVLKLLTKNVRDNYLDNITVIPKGAWRSQGSIDLGFQLENQAKSLIEGLTGPNLVEVSTIDSVVTSLHLDRVNFISLTINGAEIEALQGAMDTMIRYKPNLSVTGWVYRDGQPLWKVVKPMLEDIGYSCLVGKRGRVLAWKP